eukprot:148374-Chlamydomonas_euryale.AAC.5
MYGVGAENSADARLPVERVPRAYPAGASGPQVSPILGAFGPLSCHGLYSLNKLATCMLPAYRHILNLSLRNAFYASAGSPRDAPSWIPPPPGSPPRGTQWWAPPSAAGQPGILPPDVPSWVPPLPRASYPANGVTRSDGYGRWPEGGTPRRGPPDGVPADLDVAWESYEGQVERCSSAPDMPPLVSPPGGGAAAAPAGSAGNAAA